jgi:hypothetical protein
MMFGIVLACWIIFAVSPGRAAPAALIEDINGKPAGLKIMDYLDSGSVLRLGARDSLVITYFSSCVREKIRGGIVTIGARQSDVQSGEVERTTVKCDRGKMLRPPSDFAGNLARSSASAQLVIYGISPIIEVEPPGVLFIDRMDTGGEHHAIDVGSEPLLQGRFYDLAERRKMLGAGGTYRALFGAKAIVFKIDAHAMPGHSPMVGRLIRLAPPR